MEKYDVINVVGEGSYGLVMRCRHRESGQYVAIKRFLETEDDPTVKKMALREIRMLKKLRHENLVNMLEVFRRKKRFFLVFEYLEHTVLEELEARVGGLGFITSRKYIYQLLRALDFIHSHDVIHRDIKPENVLVSRLGVIKLCDFGFARLYAENETFTDYVATRWYRSPELLVGDNRYGKEVDIWAVGCLYSEMMTGEPLFPGDSDIDQLFQIIKAVGKLSPRHQTLITKNSIFKGMKHEQSTTIIEMFPDWNRESLDFLILCLKMDGSLRPTTRTLLSHQLFTKDDFIENFIPELRNKLNQESQSNPLFKRFVGSDRRNSEEKSRFDNILKANSSIKERSSQLAATKYQKSNQDKLITASITNPESPSSPVQFQSLQNDINILGNNNSNINISSHVKHLSPVSSISMNEQHFNQKRNLNTLSNQKGNKTSNQQKPNIPKVIRNNLLQVNNSFYGENSDLNKDISPRLPVSYPWLTGNIKIMPLTKGIYTNGKRGFTDWKTIARESNTNFLFANHLTSSTSPYKGNKKKLSPVVGVTNYTANSIRNFSPSSDQENET